MKNTVTEQQIKEFTDDFKNRGFDPFIKSGTESTAVCIIGNTATIDMETIVQTTPYVSYGRRITEPYKRASRLVHPEDTHILFKNFNIGEGFFHVIAGPCSIESKIQMIEIAESVKISGATLLRGGAFKPRSSPYSFQGMGEDGLKLLIEAKKQTGLPIVTEIMEISELPMFDEVDVIQVGARNMQNFKLLTELGKIKKPILLKRGMSSSIEELLLSAEYILAGGNEKVILCERGIRTFETQTRNTLDLSAIPILKKQTHLPIIIDPSHATGKRDLVEPMAKAAIAAGADGLMIEVHNNPSKALCDGAQSLDLPQFTRLMQDVKRRVEFEGKKLN